MFSFHLSEQFLEPYKYRKPPFGYEDAAGNSLGELVFLRTYSRLKPDGTKERWWEVCERVINGMFSIQKDHVRDNRLPWSNFKAQKTAQDAFDRLFNLKWSPPGRGLWIMGTPLVNVHRNSAALQNCAFISTMEMTREDPAAPFTFLMEASMLGIGVGFDTKGASKDFKIYNPSDEWEEFIVPDSREGWVDSLRVLIESYLKPDKKSVFLNYSQVRPAGEPIKTFGGTASGPGPLSELHENVRKVLGGRGGERLTTVDIADLGNMIGVCVVAGNVRRSAELLIGSVDDPDFLNLKNYEVFPERNSTWGWMSNNSVEASVGQDLSAIVPGIALNGEPGVVWMDLSRKYGRLIDPVNNKDHRAAGYNPCAEQTLESGECCTLVETFIDRHDDLDDYLKTLKVAYLYAKTVTLLPTHWHKTNAIMQRNRRIGSSMSGVANFLDNNGALTLLSWMDTGYKEIQRLDNVYSEWLCVRESIKTTTVKPSGTVSILAGSSPGVHWAPGGQYFMRTIRFSKDDPMVVLFEMAGYRIEPAQSDPKSTVVVYFPVKSQAKRSEREVPIGEKVDLAALAQYAWSDNSVSVTVSFDPDTEADRIGGILTRYAGKLKTVSFLPMMEDGAYEQMPYGRLTPEEWEDASMTQMMIDWSGIYEGLGREAIGEAYCETDACLVREFKLNEDAVLTS